MTSRPLDKEALQKACDDVERVLGREALVEAAGVAGLFDCFTRFADATGKVPLPSTMLTIMSAVLGSFNWVYSFFM